MAQLTNQDMRNRTQRSVLYFRSRQVITLGLSVKADNVHVISFIVHRIIMFCFVDPAEYNNGNVLFIAIIPAIYHLWTNVNHCDPSADT